MLASFDATGLIGPAIGIIAIAVSVYLWRRGRVRKEIAYRLTFPSVVSVHRNAGDRISVLYDGKPVGEVRLLDLRIANAGNADITAADFEEPFVVDLGKRARLLTEPKLGKTNPPDLRPSISQDGTSVVIAPLLLNAGDSLEVTALVSDLSAGPVLTARIAGVPRLSNAATVVRSPQRLGSHGWTWLATVVAVVASVGSILSVLIRGPVHNKSVIVVATGRALCGDVLRVDATTVVLKLKEGGILRALPISGVKAIKDDAC